MTTARPGVSAGHEVNPDLNPDTEQDPYLTVTQEVDPEVLRIHIGQGATREAEAEDGTVGIAQEVEVVLTTVTRVIVEPTAEADPEVVLTVITVDPVARTRTTVTTAEVEAEARGATVIEGLEATTGDPDRTALTAKAIAVTPTTGAPVEAADTAENI